MNGNDNQTGFPRYQLSHFVGNDKNAPQVVVRSNDFEEFKRQIQELKEVEGMIEPVKQSTAWLNEPVREPVRERVNESEQALVCNTCGQPATARSGVSKKTGKAWKALFCSTNDKSHVVWL